jgi:hypothetical protein
MEGKYIQEKNYGKHRAREVEPERGKRNREVGVER